MAGTCLVITVLNENCGSGFSIGTCWKYAMETINPIEIILEDNVFYKNKLTMNIHHQKKYFETDPQRPARVKLD